MSIVSEKKAKRYVSDDAQLLSEWHPTKNFPLTPNMITYGSTKRLWWVCGNGHEWQATANNRSTGYGCPFCSGRKPISGVTDLKTVRPDLALEWNYERNLPLTVNEVSVGSKKQVWWRCKNGHEWKAAVYSRNEGNGCPICAKRSHSSLPEQAIYYYIKIHFSDALNSFVIPKTRMELDIFIPSLSVGIEYDGAAWHNNPTVLAREQKKYNLCISNNIKLIRIKEELENGIESHSDELFTLPKCPSFWDLDNTITNLLCYLGIMESVNSEADINKIRSQYLFAEDKRTLASVAPHLTKEWHPTLNEPLTPQMVMANAHDKVWWLCDYGHEWRAAVYSRVHGNNCPVCSGQKVLVGYNDLATTHPLLLKEWHPSKNLPITPQSVSHGSKKEAIWICNKGHEWKAAISTRTKGIGCPYCANKKVLSGYNDLKTLCPHVAKEWHPNKNGTLTPDMVVLGSGNKVWWLCSKCGYEWQARVVDRAKGRGCLQCVTKNRKKT